MGRVWARARARARISRGFSTSAASSSWATCIGSRSSSLRPRCAATRTTRTSAAADVGGAGGNVALNGVVGGVCACGARATFDDDVEATTEPAAAAEAVVAVVAAVVVVVVVVVAAAAAECYCVGVDNVGVDEGDNDGVVAVAVVVVDGVDGVGDEDENDDEVCRWRRWWWLLRGWWWWWCEYDGNGREPRSLIRALPRRRSLVLFFLPKQVRGPVREIEESEYDGEEDP